MMLSRLLVMFAAFALLAARPALANPITYDFTGTLWNGFAADGSKDFSGAFTIDGNVTPNPPGSWQGYEVDEKGSEVSLTLNIGGQTYKYENNANSLVELTVGTSPSWYGDGPRQEEIILKAVDLPYSTPFWMTFYTPASMQNLSDLRTLNFIPGTGSAQIYTPVYSGDAYFTSVTLVPTPTPEPGAVTVFALAGVAAFVKLRRR